MTDPDIKPVLDSATAALEAKAQAPEPKPSTPPVSPGVQASSIVPTRAQARYQYDQARQVELQKGIDMLQAELVKVAEEERQLAEHRRQLQAELRDCELEQRAVTASLDRMHVEGVRP